MSKEYTFSCSIIDTTLPYDIPCFRKRVDYIRDTGYIELCIVNIVAQHQCPELLRIYGISNSFYDAELLDINHKDTSAMARDVFECLCALHRLGIVYVDLSRDNIGYSTLDRRWKVFDFDCSGIFDLGDPTKWVVEPGPYENYKRAMSCLESTFNLCEIDMYMFDHVFGQNNMTR
jgi:hypothetical protein